MNLPRPTPEDLLHARLNLKLGGDTRLRFDYSNRMVDEFFDDTNEFAVRLTF